MVESKRRVLAPIRPLARGMRTSVRENSSAYGYSVSITAALAVLAALQSPPSVAEVFLFIGGAGAAFTTVEVVAGKLFSGEPVEAERVVLVGTLLNAFSITGAVATAALVGWVAGGWLPWLLGPFAATSVYVVIVGVEMAVAERLQEGG